jgi:hypothetical protein
MRSCGRGAGGTESGISLEIRDDRVYEPYALPNAATPAATRPATRRQHQPARPRPKTTTAKRRDERRGRPATEDGLTDTALPTSMANTARARRPQRPPARPSTPPGDPPPHQDGASHRAHPHEQHLRNEHGHLPACTCTGSRVANVAFWRRRDTPTGRPRDKQAALGHVVYAQVRARQQHERLPRLQTRTYQSLRPATSRPELRGGNRV